jgi:hypothetical protein
MIEEATLNNDAQRGLPPLVWMGGLIAVTALVLWVFAT